MASDDLDRPVTKEELEALCRAAKVRSHQKEYACYYLSSAVRNTRKAYEGAKLLASATADHDPALLDVQMHAKNLANALKRLEKVPLAYDMFWELQSDGPVYERAERMRLLKALEELQASAEKAKNHYKRGRLPERWKDVVVRDALLALRSISNLALQKGSEGLKDFIAAYFAVVTGLKKVTFDRSLDRVWSIQNGNT